MPNVTKCRKYVTIQSVFQVPIILMKTKSGRIFHKSPKLFPSEMEKISSPIFVDFDLKTCISKKSFKNVLTASNVA